MSTGQKHRRTTRHLAAPKSYDLWLRWGIPPSQRIARTPRPHPPRPARTPANFPRMKDRAGARRRRAAALLGAPGLFASLNAQFRPFAEAFAEVGHAIGAQFAELARALRPPTIPHQREYALAPISAPDQVGGHPEGDTPS